jgi:hypothetical protein
LDFSDKFVTIKEGGNAIKYFAADASVLTVPTRKISFPEAEVEFTLTSTMLNMIHRTASVLRATDLQIIGDGEKIVVQVGDKKNLTGNSYNAHVGSTDKTFQANLKVENMKMLPGDYIVSISSKKISRFKASTSELVYYVAVEADSTFSV